MRNTEISVWIHLTKICSLVGVTVSLRKDKKEMDAGERFNGDLFSRTYRLNRSTL